MNTELEDLVLNCQLCLKYSTAKHKLEPSLSLGQEVPLHPWTKLVADIFHFEGTSYLLIEDYTSCYPVVHKVTSMTGQHIASQFKLICSEYGWPETIVSNNGPWYTSEIDYTSHYPVVHKVTSMTGQHIASQFKLIYSEYGWPETVVSDNGPCYTSEIFNNLMIEYNVNHITSLPHYPQSNGLAEKYVHIVKNLFYKAKEEAKDLYKCLMVCCNTPLSSNLQSPMQILASRSARSNLPMSNAARRQKGLDCKHLRTQYKNEQVPSHDLHFDQAVMYQDPNDKRWYPATITRLCQEPRSYIITTKQGVQYRKTQANLKPYHPHSEYELLTQERHKWTVPCAQNKLSATSLAQSRPKRDIKPPNRMDL